MRDTIMGRLAATLPPEARVENLRRLGNYQS
jgi:hypothetical protein